MSTDTAHSDPDVPLPDTATLDAASRARLEALAARYSGAKGVGIQVLGVIGSRADTLLERLPMAVRSRLDSATRAALEVAFDAAHRSRRSVADRPDWLNTVVTTAMGAAGGAGGLPTALAELPVTTTVLLRAIQGIAADEGFDTEDPKVRLQCLQVFAAEGPLSTDGETDLGFLTTRISLSGAALHGVIARVAPRLGLVLGQKLAAQTVPILGAAAGAATNYAFTSYYQEMARVYFGLRAMARDGDVDTETLLREFRLIVRPPRALR